jgi:hypothetical protein
MTTNTDIAQHFFEHADRIKKLAEMTEGGISEISSQSSPLIPGNLLRMNWNELNRNQKHRPNRPFNSVPGSGVHELEKAVPRQTD